MSESFLYMGKWRVEALREALWVVLGSLILRISSLITQNVVNRICSWLNKYSWITHIKSHS